MIKICIIQDTINIKELADYEKMPNGPQLDVESI